MKVTTVYRGEFLVIECPYCCEEHYINVEDDIGEGNIPEDGRRMKCRNPECTKIMLVTECYA